MSTTSTTSPLPHPAGDHLVVLQVVGMHCHKCQATLTRILGGIEGVHEVEVDFPSKQASVLHDRSKVELSELIEAVADAGYRVSGYVEREVI
jgi:copper chaperone CopZ